MCSIPGAVPTGRSAHLLLRIRTRKYQGAEHFTKAPVCTSLFSQLRPTAAPRAIAEIVREIRGRLSINDANPAGMSEPLKKRLTITPDGQPYPDE